MPIEAFDPENSVLFLGSGFSANAINIANERVPSGHPLTKRLMAALNEDDTDFDLKSAADEFSNQRQISLYYLLHETFTIKSAIKHQREILSLPWARIYTTNYDDIINHIKGINFPIFTFDEPRPKRLPKAFAVHLHGSIRRADEKNADDQLIINNKSYDIIARQYHEWFDEFRRDRQTFDACYFMGFSLSDHHISGLMTSGKESTKRTFFISKQNPKPAFVKRAQEYGEVVPIGFDGFLELTKTLPKPERPHGIEALQSFKFLRPGLDAKALANPTPVEIINLVSFGTFSQSRFFNTPTDHTYVAPRSSSVDETLSALRDAKTVLIHSRLGNGKSIFTSILAKKAADEGYVCLQWRRAGRQLAQDLEIVSGHNRVLVIFDDYDAAIEGIDRVSAGVPTAKFIVTVRTGQQEVRFHEIAQRMPAPVKRVGLNIFGDIDKKILLKILNNAGAQVQGLENAISEARDIRDIVTGIYNHSEIGRKIEKIIRQSSANLIQILVLASLIKWAGVNANDSYLQELVGRDVYGELRKADGLLNDIIDVFDDKVEMRSVHLADYLIQRIFTSEEVLDGCFEITTSSTRRKKVRAHRRLSAELMKFSTLQHFLKFRTSSSEVLERHYVRLSNDKDVNAEPLFWLQYAILMKTSGDIRNARMFLDAGYERAAKIEGFKSFQLDTQALSIYLFEEIQSSSPTVEGFDTIVSAIKTVTNMISEESNRYHAIQVLGEVPTFVEARGKALAEPEKIAIVYELNRTSRALADLSIEEKTSSGSETVRVRIEASIRSLYSTGGDRQ